MSNNNVHSIDNYHNVDVENSNAYNVEENEEINNSRITIIGNTTTNQNIPNKRNTCGSRKKRERKKKERHTIRGQERTIEKKDSKNL